MKVAVSKRKRHPLLGDDSNTTEAAWSGVQSLDGIVESSDLTAAPQSSSSAVPVIAGATAMASTMETTTCTVVPPEPMPSSSDGSKNKNENKNKKKKRNIVNDPNRFICQMPGCAYRWVMSRPLAAKSFLLGFCSIIQPPRSPPQHHTASRRTAWSSHFKRHMSGIHNENIKWFMCEAEGCTYKAKVAGILRQHMQNIHSVGVVWHPCTEPGCTYR